MAESDYTRTSSSRPSGIGRSDTTAGTVKGADNTADSAASRVAAGIRNRVVDGELLPGQRLTEDVVRADYSVSRSTLREAFHLLVRERLLVHHLSRGFFVREVNESDLADLFFTRRVLECGALRQVTTLDPEILKQLHLSIRTGRAAAAKHDWQRTASASIQCHRTLVALAKSPRLNNLIEQVLAEFRLAYSLMADPLAFHLPFLERNEALVDLVSQGEIERAVSELALYLDDSETRLTAMIKER